MFTDVPFEEYSIASTAFMFILSDNVNIDLLFPLLHTERQTKSTESRDVIVGAKYKNYSRGNISKTGCMKNTILVEMITDKRLSIKINLNKIHVCGTKSIEDAKYAAQIIADHINDVYNYLRIVHDDPDEWLSIVDKYIIKNSYDKLDTNPILLKYIKCQEMDYNDGVYGTTDRDILRLQLHRIADVTNIPTDVSIIGEKTNMLNYNYNIVNNLQGRDDLLPNRMIIIERVLTLPNAVIEADNRLKQNVVVSVEVPTDSSDGDGIDLQKFIIHRNGKIAHSGHSISMMKKGYQLLMDALSTIDYSKHVSSRMKLSDILKEYTVDELVE